MAVRIGVISDTHGLLRPEVMEILSACPVILHGGDINKPELLETLRGLGQLYVVRGNNDKEWAEKLPLSLRFTVEGVTFWMVHNRKDVPAALDGVQIVVFGHSHKYFEQEQEGRLWLNPGSCGRRRFGLELSMAVIEADRGQYRVEKIVIPQESEKAPPKQHLF